MTWRLFSITLSKFYFETLHILLSKMLTLTAKITTNSQRKPGIDT